MKLLIAAAAVLIAVGIVFMVKDQNRWEKWCHSQGGHVTSNSKTVTTVGSNGKPGVGTETTYYCLTSDGRIIDIR